MDKEILAFGLTLLLCFLLLRTVLQVLRESKIQIKQRERSESEPPFEAGSGEQAESSDSEEEDLEDDPSEEAEEPENDQPESEESEAGVEQAPQEISDEAREQFREALERLKQTGEELQRRIEADAKAEAEADDSDELDRAIDSKRAEVEAKIKEKAEGARKALGEFAQVLSGVSSLPRSTLLRLGARFLLQILMLNVAIWLLFPAQFSGMVYQTLYIKIFAVIPALAGFLLVARKARREFSSGNPAGASVSLTFAVIVFFVMNFALSKLNQWRTAERYQFQTLAALPDVDARGIRYTPFDVAFTDFEQKLGSAEFTVRRERMSAVDRGDSVGYVVPITPDGVIPTFGTQADGLMVFDDSPGVSNDDRVRRVNQPFVKGEGMLYFDSIWRALYLDDPFCLYPEIYYLELEHGGKTEFVAVAPKVEYDYEFPCFFVPVWAGVTLVYSDGKLEHLDAEQVTLDSRLKGKRVFPEWLARKIVEAQTFDEGMLSGFYSRKGLIRIPKLPGGQQMPYLTRLANKRDSFLVATEPAGGSFALFRLYFVDAHDGSLSVYEISPEAGVLGPERASERVKKLPGYTWGLTHEPLESVYLPKDGKVYWKFTVTTVSRTGITLTVVVDAHANAQNNDLLVFATRKQFDDWFQRGIRPDESPSGETAGLAGVRDLLQQAVRQVEAIEKGK